MAETPENFDPFLDWSKIDDDHVKDMKDAGRQLKWFQKQFLWDSTKEHLTELIKAHHDYENVMNEICEAIWTVPAMVHIAAEPREEDLEQSPTGEATIQRCSRCGSILNMCHDGLIVMTPAGPIPQTEDSLFDVGARVGKTHAESHMSMYEIGDRELEPHEMECPNMNVFDDEGES